MQRTIRKVLRARGNTSQYCSHHYSYAWGAIVMALEHSRDVPSGHRNSLLQLSSLPQIHTPLTCTVYPRASHRLTTLPPVITMAVERALDESSKELDCTLSCCNYPPRGPSRLSLPARVRVVPEAILVCSRPSMTHHPRPASELRIASQI
jgi:hypothetical protein